MLSFLSVKIPLISYLVQYLPLFLHCFAHFLHTLSNFISTFASCKKSKGTAMAKEKLFKTADEIIEGYGLKSVK
ncbi:MAG: hypothetical protein MSA13_01380, partial [Prevotella sp.]|nr:hypothetical protein [Prevotella sp.]